jgi:hypothetical protein
VTDWSEREMPTGTGDVGSATERTKHVSSGLIMCSSACPSCVCTHYICIL